MNRNEPMPIPSAYFSNGLGHVVQFWYQEQRRWSSKAAHAIVGCVIGVAAALALVGIVAFMKAPW